MTVIVQQSTDSNGNPQPMVYDSDTEKIIVDSNGYVINGGKRLVNVPTKADYVSTPKTTTSGIQEAIDYIQGLGNLKQNDINGNWSPDILLNPGVYVIDDSATIYINNAPSNYTASGLHIHGSSGGQYNCVIVKQNSLSSPIISFSNPRGSSTTGTQPTHMIFEDFAVWYTGSASNATSGITTVNLSIEEEGGTLNVYRNLMILTTNPINNVMLDVSGNEDAEIDNVYTDNAGGTYDSSITVASLVTHISGGNVKIYNGEHSGIDIEAQNAYLSGLSIGTGAGAGIIWRPSLNGSPLLLNSVYFNGSLTRLITTKATSSGATQTGYILMNGCLLSKTPASSGDYMLDFSAFSTYLEMRSTTLYNNTSADTLYLLNPSAVGVIVFRGYDDITNRTFMINNVTLNIPAVTTPTIPTSGTAVTNSNPYPINVYLYGGTVTEIQITKGGTAYTVFSNSTGLALSGQVYELGIEESITITYTSAPTWVWVKN